MNPLYDYVFLNLEGALRRRGGEGDGRGSAQPERGQPQGADRPHPADRRRRRRGARRRASRKRSTTAPTASRFRTSRSVEEAKLAIGFFQEAKANVWSPSNPGGRTHRDADARGSGGGRAGERGRGPEGLQHPRLRHRQPDAGARRRSRRRRSRHAEGARRSQAREARRHADRESPGRRPARQGRLPRAADARPDGRRSDHDRPATALHETR